MLPIGVTCQSRRSVATPLTTRKLRSQPFALPLLGEVQLGSEPAQAIVGLRQFLRTCLHQLLQLARERPQSILAVTQGLLPLFALGDVTGYAVMADRSTRGTVLVASQIRDPAQGPVRADNAKLKLMGTMVSAVERFGKLLPHSCTVFWMDKLLEVFGSRDKLVRRDAEKGICFRRPPESVRHHIPVIDAHLTRLKRQREAFLFLPQ